MSAMHAGRLLFVCNGYAEDKITACIIAELQALLPDADIGVLPLVGQGLAFADMDVRLLGTRKRMPSAGFIAGNPAYVLRDLGAGWLKDYWRNGHIMRRQTEEAELVVCVGDVFLLLTVALFCHRQRTIFVATAKSDYIAPHWEIEKLLMRWCCERVWARDAATAVSLRRGKVPAVYEGSVLMDCLEFTEEQQDFTFPPEVPVIGILPGSKPEAYRHLQTMLGAVSRIHRERKGRVGFVLSLARTLALDKLLAEVPGEEGWRLVQASDELVRQGILLQLRSSEGAGVLVAVGRFADVLRRSRVVIGTAGMANEQAVGLGKPVVTFPGTGPQFTSRFVRAQKRLLGDALLVAENKAAAVARKVLEVLDDEHRHRHFEQVGRQRMGRPGAARRIAVAIQRLLTENATFFP